MDEPNLPAAAATTPPHEIKVNFAGLLLSFIGLACLLNNVNRAVLNLNYVTGSDPLSSWDRVQQLSTSNFTQIYIAFARNCAWAGKLRKVFEGPDATLIPSYKFGMTCDQNSEYYCVPAVDEAACFLHFEILAILAMRTNERGGLLRNERSIFTQ